MRAQVEQQDQLEKQMRTKDPDGSTTVDLSQLTASAPFAMTMDGSFQSTGGIPQQFHGVPPRDMSMGGLGSNLISGNLQRAQ